MREMPRESFIDDSPAVGEARQLEITLRNAGVNFKLQDGEITAEGHKLLRQLNSFLLILDDHVQDHLFGYEVRPVRIVKFARPPLSEQTPPATPGHLSA